MSGDSVGADHGSAEQVPGDPTDVAYVVQSEVYPGLWADRFSTDDPSWAQRQCREGERIKKVTTTVEILP